MNLKKCQIFTPTEIVNLMLDKVGYNKGIFGKKIIDNSCGNGNFLIEILRRFLQEAKAKRVSKKDIKRNIENCIFGYEIDEVKYNECIKRLNDVALEYNINNICWNVHCADGLSVDKDNEFDYVIGNPPYIAYKDLDKEIRIDVKKKFTSCNKGKFDYSYAFIEKGLSLLKSQGKMIMISPSNMFKTIFGGTLRELIKPHLIEIIDCSHDKIFDKVLTAPSITLCEKNVNRSSIEYRVGLDEQSREIDKASLNGKWIFEKINRGDRQFGDYFKVSNSIATLSNKIFIHNVNENGQVIIDGICIEKEILRVAKSPRSEKYGIKQKIIFPYKYKNGKLERIVEKDLKIKSPNAYQYLIEKKDELEKRDSDSNAEWFEYGRSQALAHLNQKKLMLSSIITNEVMVYELDTEEIPYSGMYIVPKSSKSMQEAKAILCSNEFYNYLLKVGIPVSGVSVRISSKDIENYKF